MTLFKRKKWYFSEYLRLDNETVVPLFYAENLTMEQAETIVTAEADLPEDAVLVREYGKMK